MDHPSAQYIPILYKRYAKAWQKIRAQSEFVEKSWLDRFIDQLTPAGNVIDLGCGSGYPIAAYLLNYGFNIEGVDNSKPFIKSAKKAFPSASWQLEDMRSFPITTQYEGIIAWDSFFHLTRDEQKKMFARFSQLAKSGAPLMFTSGHENGEAIGDFNGHELYHSSLDPDEYRRLLIEHGFGLLSYKLEDPSCGYRSIWLAKKR